MTRGLTILAALVATLAVALPASAAEGWSAKATIVSVSATSVTFKDAKNVATTCALRAKSPSLDGYRPGDAVQVACLRSRSDLVLAKIRHVTAPGTGETKTVTFGGVVTALTATSISLHDGDRDLTCGIGPSSPSTAGVQVGIHVKVACANGVLAVLLLVPTGDGGTGTTPPPPPPPPTEHHTLTVGGMLTVLSSASVTVHSAEKGDVSCTVGPSTPPLGDFHVGDHVGMACVDGVVAKLVRL